MLLSRSHVSCRERAIDDRAARAGGAEIEGVVESRGGEARGDLGIGAQQRAEVAARRPRAAAARASAAPSRRRSGAAARCAPARA